MCLLQCAHLQHLLSSLRINPLCDPGLHGWTLCVHLLPPTKDRARDAPAYMRRSVTGQPSHRVGQAGVGLVRSIHRWPGPVVGDVRTGISIVVVTCAACLCSDREWAGRILAPAWFLGVWVGQRSTGLSTGTQSGWSCLLAPLVLDGNSDSFYQLLVLEWVRICQLKSGSKEPSIHRP